jgi:hypothetical protein
VVSVMLGLLYGMSADECMGWVQMTHDQRVCHMEVPSPQTVSQQNQVRRILRRLVRPTLVAPKPAHTTGVKNKTLSGPPPLPSRKRPKLQPLNPGSHPMKGGILPGSCGAFSTLEPPTPRPIDPMETDTPSSEEEIEAVTPPAGAGQPSQEPSPLVSSPVVVLAAPPVTRGSKADEISRATTTSGETGIDASGKRSLAPPVGESIATAAAASPSTTTGTSRATSGDLRKWVLRRRTPTGSSAPPLAPKTKSGKPTVFVSLSAPKSKDDKRAVKKLPPSRPKSLTPRALERKTVAKKGPETASARFHKEAPAVLGSSVVRQTPTPPVAARGVATGDRPTFGGASRTLHPSERAGPALVV